MGTRTLTTQLLFKNEAQNHLCFIYKYKVYGKA